MYPEINYCSTLPVKPSTYAVAIFIVPKILEINYAAFNILNMMTRAIRRLAVLKEREDEEK